MEIEIKARVENLSIIRRRLIQFGARKIKKVRQIDMYYSLYKRPLNKKKGSVVRVRHNKNTNETTVEYDTAFNAIAAEEVEVRVDSLRAIENFLRKIKAKKEVVVDKQREYWQIGIFEIVLDKVRGLGTFIEVEIDGTNSKTSRKKVENFLRKLGISSSQYILGPKYNSMLLKKKGREYAYF